MISPSAGAELTTVLAPKLILALLLIQAGTGTVAEIAPDDGQNGKVMALGRQLMHILPADM